MSDALQVHTIVSQPFDENTYVVWRAGQRDALVIDAGFEPELILQFLKEHELTPVALLNTHGHADHIAGNQTLEDEFPHLPILIGTNDAIMLTDAQANLSAPFGLPVVSPPADRLLTAGEVLELAGMRFEILEIPGHSPGHIVFVHRASPIVVFGGDVLFRGSIGRSDFPNGNGPLLVQGIQRKLYTLPADTVVYPGHGPVTTIGHEMRTNPFTG